MRGYPQDGCKSVEGPPPRTGESLSACSLGGSSDCMLSERLNVMHDGFGDYKMVINYRTEMMKFHSFRIGNFNTKIHVMKIVEN